MEICRAVFGPPPACRALPKIVSATCCGCTPARSSAAFAATTPISAGESETSEPPNLPMGVRAAERMYTLFKRDFLTFQSSKLQKKHNHRGHKETLKNTENFLSLPLCSSVSPVVKNLVSAISPHAQAVNYPREHSLRNQYGYGGAQSARAQLRVDRRRQRAERYSHEAGD